MPHIVPEDRKQICALETWILLVHVSTVFLVVVREGLAVSTDCCQGLGRGEGAAAQPRRLLEKLESQGSWSR